MKKNSENSQNSFQLGYKIDSTPIVLLNALGLLGLKVVTVGGTSKEYLWTLERKFDGSPLPLLRSNLYRAGLLEVPSSREFKTSSSNSSLSDTSIDNSSRRHSKVGVKRRLSAGLSKLALFRSPSLKQSQR